MKIKIELDVLHFMSVLNFLIEANKGIDEVPEKNLEFQIFQETFNEINDQFNEQYTDRMGYEFEMQYQIRELLFNAKN